MDNPGSVFLLYRRVMAAALKQAKAHGNRSNWSNRNTLDNGNAIY